MAALNDVQTHNKKVLQSLERGDLVEYTRPLYSHWAVYVGNDMVIHVTCDENDGSFTNVESVSTVCCLIKSKGIVKVDDFWKATCGYRTFKNNDKDEYMSPYSAEQTVKRAKSKLGEKGYNALESNCEHFVNFCRYGKSQSDQADNVIVGGIVTSISTGSAVLFHKVIKNALKALVGGISAVGRVAVVAAAREAIAHADKVFVAGDFVLDGSKAAIAAIRQVIAFVSNVDTRIFGDKLDVHGMKLLASVLQEIAGKNFMGGNFGVFGALALRLIVSLF